MPNHLSTSGAFCARAGAPGISVKKTTTMKRCTTLIAHPPKGLFRRPGLTPTKIPSGGLGKRLQGHLVAQAFQPPDQGSADSVHVDTVKVIGTEFPVVVSGLCERQSKTASVADAAAQTLRHLEPIFILRCGSPRAMSYS